MRWHLVWDTTYLSDREPGAAVWVIAYYSSTWASQVAQWESTHLPTQEAWGVRSLVREDPLEEEMATHSSILPWRIPWTEEPGGLQSRGLQSQTQLSTYACKALKASLWDRASNPGSPTDCLISKQVTNHCWVSISSPVNMEKEMATHSSIPAWRILWMEEPSVHGVAQSQTWLKRLHIANMENGNYFVSLLQALCYVGLDSKEGSGWKTQASELAVFI